MLTPILEKLILSGKASYNTFVVGGSEKHILNVENDRFIIITDLLYFHEVNLNSKARGCTLEELNELKNNHLNTQLKVFSSKSQNTFLFRNNLDIQQVKSDPQAFSVMPLGHTKLDTYLIHESDVAFTFSYAGGRSAIGLPTVTVSESIAYPPPFDYGKLGQIGAQPIRQISEDQAAVSRTLAGGQLYSKPGNPENLELNFPVIPTTAATSLNISESYPIVLVSYVEILGNPTNISATL
jgi:hypothetical protein